MNLFAVAGLILGISSALLALVILLHGQTKLHRIWVLFNLVVAVWGFGCLMVGIAENEASALVGWKFAHVGGMLISVFFYHMICTFCELNRKKSIYTVYSVGLFFLLFNLLTDNFINKTRFVFDLYYIDFTLYYAVAVFLWMFLASWSFVELLIYFPKTKGMKRTQTLYIIWGFLIGFLGGASNFLPAFRVDTLYPFGNFTIPIYCLISTYAILRHRLMDIHLVIKKSMVYSLSAGILTSLFVVLVLSMTKILSNFAGISSFTITTISALIIAVLFNPLKNKLQAFIDKSFYKKSYDYYPTIRKISRKLISIFDLDELFQYVGNEIYSIMGLSSVYLLNTVPGRGYEVVFHKSSKKQKADTEHLMDGPKIRKSSEIIGFFRKNDEVLIKDELPGFEKQLGQEIIERIKADLEPFKGEAIVPVFTEKKPNALMILGGKISGDMFTNEDINLLNIVSNQMAVAIKNTQLYKNRVHTERLASIGMMSATFAHEIRNPLTSLKTFAQLMPEKYNDEEFRDTFSKIVVGEIERIDGLIGDLMDFSSDKKSARVNFIDLTALVDEIVDYVHGKMDFEHKEIRFEKNYGSDVINMTGDAEKLKQAFINIITNGCQAMNGSGTLRINISLNSRNVDVAVTDTGAGIDPEDMPKIFDPFVTRKEMGIGLGLAISKRIIEDHNGKIHVKSKLSRGTTFTVTLPVQNE